MLDLIAAELMKWRRTKFLWVTVAAALAAPLLVMLIMVNQESADWTLYMNQVLIFYTALLGPLISTLIGAQSIATEYDYDTWKLSLTAPVPRWQIYLVKGLVGLAWLLGLSLLAGGVGLLAGRALPNLTGSASVAQGGLPFIISGVGLSAMLPVYQGITLLTRSFFVTSGAGIIGTITGFIVLQSKFAGLFPISAATLLAAGINQPGLRSAAISAPPVWIGIAAAVSLLSLLGGLLYLERADIR